MLDRVLAAAGREASEIVTAARTEIGRVVGKARRDLLELIAQVETLREAELRASERRVATDEPLEHIRHHLVARRQALRGLVDAARRDLESLTQEPPPQSPPLSPELPPPPAAVPASQTEAEVPAAQTEFQPARRMPSIFMLAAISAIAITALLSVIGWVVMRGGNHGTPSNRTGGAAAIATALSSPASQPHSPTQTARPAAAPSRAADTASAISDSRATATSMNTAATASSHVPAAVPERSPGRAAPGAVATAGIQTDDGARQDRPELTARAHRWLDAYYRQDASGMASMSLPQPTISDDRHPDERLPAGLAVSRSIEGLTIQVAGDQAVLSGKMIEHAEAGGQPVQRISWISQMWTRQNGQWSLMDARIRADGRLK